MTSTTKTSWTEYLKTNVKQRPEGMTHNQWMSELGKKWRLQKQDSKQYSLFTFIANIGFLFVE